MGTMGLTLTEGAILERLRRDGRIRLDPAAAHAGLQYDRAQAAILAGFHREYLDIGREFDIPMIVQTDTWRASPERLRAANLDHRNVNADAVAFLQSIRSEYGSYQPKIRIAGLMGCRGESYSPRGAPGAAEAARFHRAQAEALARAGADFLMSSTLPALPEAIGLARAMGDTGLAYFVGFIVRPSGALLDGTPLCEAVDRLDQLCPHPPDGYLVNCVHSGVFRRAMRAAGSPRVVGLQANTSDKSPEELDGASALVTEDPDAFAAGVAAARREFGLRVVGGCCGSAPAHIRRLAARVASRPGAAVSEPRP